MNGDWFPWGGAQNGNAEEIRFGSTLEADGPERYIAAWRHVHGIFETQGADNVSWVWSINPDSIPDEPWNAPLEYYPGDDYVDWVGSTIFNFGDSRPELTWAYWRSFAEIVREPYRQLSTLGKPIIIPEVGSAEGSGGKGNWIHEMAVDIRLDFPLIKAIVWFNENDRDLGNWRFETSPAAESAWSEVAREEFFATEPIITNVGGGSD